MRILYLDLDTLRPDHLGCYGYRRDTSPNIDRLARESVRFDNCYCSDAPCLPSRTALMSGRFGIHTGVVNHGGTAADMRLEGPGRGAEGMLGRDCLAAFLRAAGFHTVTVSPFAERHGAWHFYAGFSEMFNPRDFGAGFERRADGITPAAARWLKANARRDNWFLHVNYWDAHTPYQAPAEFGNPFAGEPLPDWLTPEVLARHRQLAGPHGAREIMMYHNRENPRFPRQPGELRNLRDLRRLVDGYDCGIRYMDGHVGRLMNLLADAGADRDLAVIVSADHGENLGELGIYAEHATADQATCRIPMLVRWPGARAGAVDRGLHYNLDLAPTLAELLGREAPARWDGRSFAPALTEGSDCGREYLVLGQCAHVCQRSVRFGPWLYLRTWHDGYHLFPDEMLFDVARDPYEQADLAPARPDVCREAVYRLTEWHDQMMATMDSDVDPLWTVIRDGGPLLARGRLAGYCRRLARTGRGHLVPELKRRHPREFEPRR